MRARWRPRFAVLTASLVVTLLLTELVFRVIAWQGGLPDEFTAFQRFLDRGLAFEPKAYMVYTRPLGDPQSNEFGFRDGPWRFERAPGVLRVACMGGSTTESGNKEGLEASYPWLLARELEQRLQRPVEVMNCGMPGWTTAETLCAWLLLLQDFAPDAIVIHHAINDVMPRNQPGFRNDYSHWRRAWDGTFDGAGDGAFDEAFRHWLCKRSTFFAFLWMPRRGVTMADVTSHPREGPRTFDALGHLPPGTEVAFRRNVESIGLAAGAQGSEVLLLTMPVQPIEVPGALPAPSFRAGVAEHNQLLRELAAEHGWGLVDAESLPREHPELAAEVFLDFVHLTRRGNWVKARRLADELVARWRAAGVVPGAGEPSDR